MIVKWLLVYGGYETNQILERKCMTSVVED